MSYLRASTQLINRDSGIQWVYTYGQKFHPIEKLINVDGWLKINRI